MIFGLWLVLFAQYFLVCRGPKGVWTLEAKGEKPNINISFNDAIPTKTHMALVALVKAGMYEVSISLVFLPCLTWMLPLISLLCF